MLGLKSCLKPWPACIQWAAQGVAPLPSALLDAARLALREVRWDGGPLSVHDEVIAAWKNFAKAASVQRYAEVETAEFPERNMEETAEAFAATASERGSVLPLESALGLAISAFLKRDMGASPRLPSCASALAEVEAHFAAVKSVDKPTLALYQSMLRCGRVEVLAFLQSCLERTTDSLFHEMPTHLISAMRGRACRTRDHEQAPAQSPPTRGFSKVPTLLCVADGWTLLLVRGAEVARVKGGGLLAPLPTSSALEQLAIACDAAGTCRLLSATRRSLEVLSTFDLSVPEGERVEWLDARAWEGHIVLFWGGLDALRGQASWSFCAGIQPAALSAGELFYEVPHADEAADSIFAQALAGKQDFAAHGNLLTLWTQHVDQEVEGLRFWRQKQALLAGVYKLAEVAGALGAWGSPQQYVTLEVSGDFRVWQCGEERHVFAAPPKAEDFCVMYAHSR